ncbi:MAG TPA: phosphoenolpyruvate--protein phosphotransferase [Anaerolineae bacterium]|nr:phosphoenolpyruvate--protein phosphotransferase [Anaerolineae bacterium]
MVNLVLVSHSQSLAAGVAELARAMTQQSSIVIATAAGTGDPANPLGTNPEDIQHAIEAAFSDDGVLVLMDLGSAVIGAEMALEFLPDAQRGKVRLCEAPMIEGSIAAAVQASLGGTLDQVMNEALGALASKAAQLGREPIAPVALPMIPDVSDARTIAIEITNRLGLHARPAAVFVQTAARFKSDISIARVSNETQHVNAKSINAVASFGVRQHEELRIWAQGPDAAEALAALEDLIESKFGEDDGAAEVERVTEVKPITPAAAGELIGIAASPGIAIGPAVMIQLVEPKFDRRTINDPAAEWSRLEAALSAVSASTQKLREEVARAANDYEAAIFDAHLMFLTDPELLARTRMAIDTDHINAEAAWQAAIDSSVAAFEAIDDPYLRARAADVADIGRQVLSQLTGQSSPAILPHAGILIARDLAPSDTARLDRSKVLGICTELGGPTSHSAILARTLGIPAVVGLGSSLMTVHDGKMLVMDGQSGQVWIDPAHDFITQQQTRLADWQSARDAARLSSTAPAITRDGRSIEVVANIGSVTDARTAIENGAEGVGLLRTEFLFLDRVTAPTEDEQVAAYRSIAEVMGLRPVIVRTLDVGGDKPLPYLDLGHEDNPFLGQRAIRLCLNRPELFKTQLRAILRASVDHNLKIMFPMIAEVSEVRRARELLNESRAELKAQNIPMAGTVEVGIMVEIPAAALLAHAIASEIDFFSIGTNDLTQYTLAAERGNPSVAHLQDALHPAVLRQIQTTVHVAQTAGKWVGVCGELAGDSQAIPILIGLGVKELSMASASIPHAKQIIRALNYSDAISQAADVVNLESATAVRQIIY